MRGTVSKRLKRIAQDKADPVYDKHPIPKLRKVKRHGWIKCPTFTGNGDRYQLVCLGVRRMYLDLKKAYGSALDLTKRPQLSQSDRMAMIGRVNVHKVELSRGATRRRRELIRRATA
jgi:hypothetical protein